MVGTDELLAVCALLEMPSNSRISCLNKDSSQNRSIISRTENVLDVLRREDLYGFEPDRAHFHCFDGVEA